MSSGMVSGGRPAKRAFLAFIFDPPLEGKLAAVNTVIEEAQRREREVRFWLLDRRLIVCVAVPDIGVDTGLDLYHALRARNVAWDALECAAPGEFYRAPAVPSGHRLLVCRVEIERCPPGRNEAA